MCLTSVVSELLHFLERKMYERQIAAKGSEVKRLQGDPCANLRRYLRQVTVAPEGQVIVPRVGNIISVVEGQVALLQPLDLEERDR